MALEVPQVTLDGPLDLTLPNGALIRIRPGPHGKGIAVVRMQDRPHEATLDGTGRPGRKPNASTIRLRERLLRDREAGALRESAHYIQWLRSIDDHVSLDVARQTVYRERKRIP